VRSIELEQYLHAQIPLSKAMALSVLSVSEDAVVLRAPLAPNINHSDAVFGGSAAALATLAAWSLPFVRLRAAGRANRLVIQRNTMEYLRPMTGEFAARSAFADPDAWPRFIRTLTRKGLARIAVTAELEFAGEVTGRFSGEFVAFAAAVPQR
jgi:thioesterase domain-containing protein